MTHRHIRDHYLPPDREGFRKADPRTGRIIVIAPTRAACETIERALFLDIDTLLRRQHGHDVDRLARSGKGFGIVAGTGTGKTLAIRPIAEATLSGELRVGVVNREREATPETPSWNVVIVTTGIARRWFQDELIQARDTLVVDEIHQTSAELELCLALGKRVGCRFIWLSATVDPSFYERYLDSAEVLESSAFDASKEAKVETVAQKPRYFLGAKFIRRTIAEKRGVAVFLPTRAEVEEVASEVGDSWGGLNTAFYHGGEPIRVIRPFLDGTAGKPYLLAMTAAGQSALNIAGLDTVVINDARYTNLVERGRNVLSREYLGANEILQMAGRVHGRVAGGEVYILTDRRIDFDALEPTPPEFQLAGDSERVALTAAAIGVDLSDLDLPVPLDRRAYRRAVRNLTDRGIIDSGRLTAYGRDVEAMPVDRPWAELLVHSDSELVPYLAVSCNIDSLHRMTRDDSDLRGLIVGGSDHLSAYNVYAEAVNLHGYVGEVYGLPRHQFPEDEIDEWADGRGVLVKAIDDIALGMASVYRTLELKLPEQLPPATGQTQKKFADLVARIMPFDLAINEETADGQRVRVSRSSVCNGYGAVAGTIRFFADKRGIPRGAIEGTNIPMKLVQRYARETEPTVELNLRPKGPRLQVKTRTEYFGFELDSRVEGLPEPFPEDLANEARDCLVRSVLLGQTNHPDQNRISRELDRIREYWRRSGGSLELAEPEELHSRLRLQLEKVRSWEDFLATPLELRVEEVVSDGTRHELEQLPDHIEARGWRLPVRYEVENGNGVARVIVRPSQARKLRRRDLPSLDRTMKFAVPRKNRPDLEADTIKELKEMVAARQKGRRHSRSGGRRGGKGGRGGRRGRGRGRRR